MNKPSTMSHKEWIIKRLAIKLVVSEKIIDAVVTNQFDLANEMLTTKNSIEFSGFGKFVFNMKKAIKRMTKFKDQQALYEGILIDETLSESAKIKNQKKLETVLNNIKALKDKIR